MHTFTAASLPNRNPQAKPPLPLHDNLLYYQNMKRQKHTSGKTIRARRIESPDASGYFRYVALPLCLIGGMLAFSAFLAPPASADIYRWEDESGVIHFTDDLSSIPPEYRGKSREILKTPPAAGQPSLSTMGAPSSSEGQSSSPMPSSVETIYRPPVSQDDDAALASMLRAKIDAKEQFIRGVDEKQSLATNPYRNRIVSPSDLELYRKYKEELPGDREHLKALESRLAPAREQ